MKKFLAFFLAFTVVFSMATMFTSVSATEHDANGIPTIDYLDFSPTNNKWDERDGEGNLVHTSFTDSTMIEKDGKYYYPHAIYLEDNGYNKNLDYEFLQGGEVIRLTATGDDNPGMAFDFARLRTLEIGSQSSGAYAEYIKIRLKNNSPSTKLTFMGTNESMGAGRLDPRIRATIDVEPNSAEWQTITISMVDGTLNTTGEKGRWASYLKQFAIFPFGYSGDNEAIVNDKYYVDIDYVVIGSYEYVTAYQSALETKENAAIEFEFDAEPTKKEYFLGQSLDLEGLKANVKYGEDKNGDPLYADEVLNGDGVSAVYNFDKPLKEDGTPIDADSWTSTVTLMYGALLLNYDVTVYDIKEIQYDYAEGETYETAIENKVYDRIALLQSGRFLPENISVKVIYSKLENGINASEIKTMQEVDLIGTEFSEVVDPSDAGYYEYLVTVNYHGHILYLPVKLIDITGLAITPVADKAGAIYYGTEIDSSFFEVLCKYSDGSTKPLADTGLASYLGISCNTKTTGGDTNATVTLVNSAYGVDVAEDVTITVQKPTNITVTLKSKNYDIDDVIEPGRFTVQYTYDGNINATVDQDDPNLIFNYDTSAPGDNLTGVVKIGDERAEFKFNVKAAEFAEGVLPLDRGGAKVKLLAPKFPTFWLVTIIVAAVIVLCVAVWAVLKYGFKVEFKRKKRVSLDDIF